MYISDLDNKSVDQNLITSIVGANVSWAVLAVLLQSFFLSVDLQYDYLLFV